MIILVIVLMIGCLVGGYFLSDSGVLGSGKVDTQKKDSNSKNDSKKEPVVTIYKTTDEEISNLITKLIVSRSANNPLEEYVMDRKIMASDVTNRRAFMTAAFEQQKETVTLDEMVQTIKKYYGQDYNFDPESVDYKSIYASPYDYDKDTKTYIKQNPIYGGEFSLPTSCKIVRAVDTDGVLKLDVKVVFGPGPKSSVNYYSDYARTNVIGEFKEYVGSCQVEDLYPKGADYQFTFKMVDGYYTFVSCEPVK